MAFPSPKDDQTLPLCAYHTVIGAVRMPGALLISTDDFEDFKPRFSIFTSAK